MNTIERGLVRRLRAPDYIQHSEGPGFNPQLGSINIQVCYKCKCIVLEQDTAAQHVYGVLDSVCLFR